MPELEMGLVPAVLAYVFRGLQIASAAGACVLLWNALAGAVGRAGAVSLSPLERAAAGQAGRADYQVIAARNLFQTREPVKVKVEEAPVALSQLQVRLLGTMAADPPAFSLGVLKNTSSNRVEVVRVGDPVALGQAKVVRIEQRRIVLDHAGRLEAVEIDELKPKKGSAASREPRRVISSGPSEDRARELTAQRMLGRLRGINLRGADASTEPAAPNSNAGGVPADSAPVSASAKVQGP
jgi:hypothetical protein